MSVVFLLVLVCLLQYAGAHWGPERSSATILTDECLPEGEIFNHTADISATLAQIAESIANGTRSDGCLDMIYLMAYTGSTSNFAGSNDDHNFEVVSGAQTRHIVLPQRPGNYEQHQGDIWKLDVYQDLGFLPGTCLRLCNIESMRLAEGGNDGWLVDSVVTFGCINDLGCKILTQDLDVHQWLDGNGFGDVDDLPLTIVTQSSCV